MFYKSFIYWVEYLLRLEFLKWSGEKGDPEGGAWEIRNQYQTKLSLTKKFGNSASSKGFNYGRPPAFILRSVKPRPHKKRFAHLALICRWQLVARYPANVFNTQSYVNQQYHTLITGSRLNQSSLSWTNLTQDLPTLHANSISPIDLLKFTFAKQNKSRILYYLTHLYWQWCTEEGTPSTLPKPSPLISSCCCNKLGTP